MAANDISINTEEMLSWANFFGAAYKEIGKGKDPLIDIPAQSTSEATEKMRSAVGEYCKLVREYKKLLNKDQKDVINLVDAKSTADMSIAQSYKNGKKDGAKSKTCPVKKTGTA